MTLEIYEVSDWNDDVAHVAAHMRAGDREEIRALSRVTPEPALRRALAVSQEAYVARWEDVPVAVFGAHTVAIGGVGVPWLLGTGVTEAHPLRFLRGSRKFITHLRETHTQLANVVHEDNHASITFLSALGFDMSEPYLTHNRERAIAFSMEGFAHV